MDATVLRAGSPSAAGLRPERIDHLRDLAAGWVESDHTPSLVVLVARRGVIALHEAFGTLRPEPDAPSLEIDSVFPVSSISKPMTATAIVQMAEEGLLGLNRPVVDYLPELCGEGTEEMLVHHLLCHTSVYNDDQLDQWTAERMAKGGFDPGPCPETLHPGLHVLLGLRWSAPVWRRPGEEMSYSNHNYLLLGEIVRRLSERRLADVMHDQLFAPLGMKDSTYSVPDDDAHRSRIVRRPADLPLAGPEGMFPGLDSRLWEEVDNGFGGCFSNAMDLAIFGQAFLNGGSYGDTSILSPASVAMMTRNQCPGVGVQVGNVWHREASYGYGWIVHSGDPWKYFHGNLQSPDSYSHPGAGGASLWVDPANELVAVYLEVTREVTEFLEHKWNFDLFQNAVAASVDD